MVAASTIPRSARPRSTAWRPFIVTAPSRDVMANNLRVFSPVHIQLGGSAMSRRWHRGQYNNMFSKIKCFGPYDSSVANGCRIASIADEDSNYPRTVVWCFIFSGYYACLSPERPASKAAKSTLVDLLPHVTNRVRVPLRICLIFPVLLCFLRTGVT